MVQMPAKTNTMQLITLPVLAIGQIRQYKMVRQRASTLYKHQQFKGRGNVQNSTGLFHTTIEKKTSCSIMKQFCHCNTVNYYETMIEKVGEWMGHLRIWANEGNY